MKRALIKAPAETGSGSLVTIQQLAARGELRHVRVDELTRSMFQPRHAIVQDEAFETLVASIGEHGVLQPVVVRELPTGQLELLAGERRLEASKACGKTTIPARVLTGIEDCKAQSIALTENLARADLSAWEQARTIATLKALRVRQMLDGDVRALGRAAGLGKSLVADLLVIAERIDERVLDAVRENGAPLALEHLSKAKLLKVANLDDPKARAFALTGLLSEKPEAVVSAPFVVRGSVDRSFSMRIARPVASLSADDASVLLGTLRPLIEALEAAQRA